MFEKFNPQVQKLLERKNGLISDLSTESKISILKTAESGNTEALKQEIDFLTFNGDY